MNESSLNISILSEKPSDTVSWRLRTSGTADAHRAMTVLERNLPTVSGDIDPYFRLNVGILRQAIFDLVATRTYNGEGSKARRDAVNWFMYGEFETFAENVGLHPEFVLEVLNGLGMLEAA